MKAFLVCFLLFVSLVHAQEVIEGAPLSIEDEPTRQLKNDQPIGTLVPVSAEINPVDGQLKFDDPVHAKKEEVKKEEAKKEIVVEQRFQQPFAPQKYIQFAFGYLDSKWEKVDPALENGSNINAFRIASDMNKFLQVGFSLELLMDKSSQSIPDNIRVLQYRLFADAHGPIFEDRLHWLGGLGFALGDYSITKLTYNGSVDVNTKISEGTIFGLIPMAGLRFYLVGQNSFDLTVEYHQYFSKPQSYIGGFALVPRFSFVF